MTSPAHVIDQLNHARLIALKDPALYAQVVPGVLPLVGAHEELQVKQWGADFLAEAFASPVWSADEKQKGCLQALDTLKIWMDNPSEDANVVKSAVQTATSIYPYVFRHSVTNISDSETWQKMASIKSSILRRMDTAPAGVRICCIKFVARVVQVQTPGMISDPRKPEQNEISLALLPRDHPNIPPANLEAEASGLLDRLLGVLQDNESDALIVTATLNSLSSLVQRRASISNKILSTVLSYNPLTLTNTPMSPRDRVLVKSCTRTTMSFLLNVLKRNPSHLLAGRIQQHVERLKHLLTETFAPGNGLKRAAPDEPIDGLNEQKRQRVEQSLNGTSTQNDYPSLPPGPVSYKELYSLTSDRQLMGFDVHAITEDIVARLLVPLMSSIDQERMNRAINEVRTRFTSLSSRPPRDATAAARAATGEDDDDDYEPDFTGGAEQVLDRLDQAPPDDNLPEVAQGPYNLPPAPPLSEDEAEEYSKTALTRVFGTLASLDRNAFVKRQKQIGLNRLASSNHDREGWVVLLIRLATRSSAGLQDGEIKNEDDAVSKKGFSLTDGIRETLYNYVLEDFRRRIGVIVTWLNEEWYNEQIQRKMAEADGSSPPVAGYDRLLLRLFNGLAPYLDKQDLKIIVRFISETPALNDDLVMQVKKLADDPERVEVVCKSLHYLVMLRPPVRETALAAIEDLWRHNSAAKTKAEPILKQWRPEVLQDGVNGTAAEVKAEG